MSREALVLLVCCCDFRDGAEWLIPSKSLRNAVIRAFPGLFCILRMCAPRRAAAVVRPRGREKSADRRRRILISRLLIIRASVPRRKSPFPAYFKGFPAVSLLIPPYPAFLKYPVSPHFSIFCACRFRRLCSTTAKSPARQTAPFSTVFSSFRQNRPFFGFSLHFAQKEAPFSLTNGHFQGTIALLCPQNWGLKKGGVSLATQGHWPQAGPLH